MSNQDLGQETTIVADWQAWIVLRHFLPAKLQRVAIAEAIRSVSNGKLSLAELIEETLSEGALWTEAWAIRPLPGVHGYASALQFWIRSLVWQNDDDHMVGDDPSDSAARGFLDLSFLQTITRMSKAKFGDKQSLGVDLEGFRSHVQPCLECVIGIVDTARIGFQVAEPEALWCQILKQSEEIQLPLQALALKHTADLLADADAWKHAQYGYNLVVDLLSVWQAPANLADVASAWRSIAKQSTALAAGYVQADDENVETLALAVESTALVADPVLALNIGFDAMEAWSPLGAREYRDPRAAVLAAPLLHWSHDPSVALSRWQTGKYPDAARHFWALLRRQIALGAGKELKATKAWYGRSLLGQVSKNVEEQGSAEAFELAGRLLVESERAEQLGHLEWNRRVVNAYATRPGLVDELAERAMAHSGVREGRTKVVLGLFSHWALQLAPAHDGIAVAMWRYVANVALTFEAAFESTHDLGRPALKALRDLAKKRPELRQMVSKEVGNAICTKLTEEFAWGRVEAMDTAVAYVDAFDDESLRATVRAVLVVLEAEDPAQGFWPLTRAGLRFLVHHKVRTRCGGLEDIDERSLKQILRFGLVEGSDEPNVFFHLADFDETLLESSGLKNELLPVLAQVKKRALEINSSNVTDHIQALLVAPAIAGPDGIHVALTAIAKVLDSSNNSRWSLGLPFIDRPLFLLSEKLDAIRRAVPLQAEWLEEDLRVVLQSLSNLWLQAENKPLLFAPFALPPSSKPNDAAVHNCALASISFARLMQDEGTIQNALEAASRNSDLKRSIILAHATIDDDPDIGPTQLDVPQVDEPESFYPTVGRRLSQMQRLPRTEAQTLCKGLISNCIRLGPDPADAALLLAAANLELHDHVRAAGLLDYTRRVKADSVTRLLLLPIVRLFRE